MPLDLRLDGEVIATIDEQVLGVSLQTARGTVSAAGLAAGDGVVDILVERVAPGGPRRLDQIEAADLESIRERNPEGTKVGFTEAENATPVVAGQGFHDETLRPGGVDKDRNQRSVSHPPTKDLAAGLDPNDVEARTKRIEAFADHGDADRAIRENKASDKPFTAEEGATPEDTIVQPAEAPSGPEAAGGVDSKDVPGEGSKDSPSSSGGGPATSNNPPPSPSSSTTGGTEPATGGAPSAGGEGGLNLGAKLPGGKASGTTKKS